MKIYLIRHGRQKSMLCNVDVELAPEGKRQARLVGERLRQYPIQAIFTSDMIRAVQTGQIIHDMLEQKLPCEIVANLREINFGDMEGLEDEELHTRYADFFVERDKFQQDLPFPNGENGAMCYARVADGIREVIHRCEEKQYETVAVVSHGGAIRCLLAGILGMDMARRLQFVKTMENCSITELDYDREKDRFYVERINDYAHLEADETLLRKYFKKVYL